MGFGPTNNSLGSYRLTTWQHPHNKINYKQREMNCQAQENGLKLSSAFCIAINMSIMRIGIL